MENILIRIVLFEKDNSIRKKNQIEKVVLSSKSELTSWEKNNILHKLKDYDGENTSVFILKSIREELDELWN